MTEAALLNRINNNEWKLETIYISGKQIQKIKKIGKKIWFLSFTFVLKTLKICFPSWKNQ